MTSTRSSHGKRGPVLLTVLLTVIGGLLLLGAAWATLPYILTSPILLASVAVVATAIFAGVAVWLFRTD